MKTVRIYRRRSYPGDYHEAEKWVRSTVARLKKRGVDPHTIMIRYHPRPRACVEVVVG